MSALVHQASVFNTDPVMHFLEDGWEMAQILRIYQRALYRPEN
jgi:hypothetical protein